MMENNSRLTCGIPNYYLQFCGFRHMNTIKYVELKSDCHGKKLPASAQQPLPEDFKQDELCFQFFHVIICYQENCEMATVNKKK